MSAKKISETTGLAYQYLQSKPILPTGGSEVAVCPFKYFEPIAFTL